MSGRILLSVPHMGELEQRYVLEAFETNWLSTVGPHIDAFEKEFGALVGRHAVALASGTAAIHLGLRLLGVGPGDDVLVSDLTFVASVNPIVYCGARPVFVDSERESWNMDPNLLEDALRTMDARGRRPRAVVVVHLYGQMADMDAIQAVCARYDVPLFEDAAEALGATYKGRAAGTMSALAAYSFNGNKIITTSGGGMLVSENKAFIDKARYWSTQAREPRIEYHHVEVGYNYRLSNVQAAIGRGQLVVLPDRVAARRRIARRYADAFADLPGIEPLPHAPWGEGTDWLSVFTVNATAKVQRDALLDKLTASNIEARPVWKPMHMQPLYEKHERFGGTIGAEAYRHGVCLPSSSSMTDAEQQRVIDVVRACCG